MDAKELLFFNGHEASLTLYEALTRRITAEIPDVLFKVRKTQISFYNRHMFACVSFLPVRRSKDRPRDFLTVTFGLEYPLDSPRIDAKTEARPDRWTHHILLGSAEEIDEEMMGWIREAAAFSAGKR